MNNYQKLLNELNNMSIEEFARERVMYDDFFGCYSYDNGLEDDRETALELEIKWLLQENE